MKGVGECHHILISSSPRLTSPRSVSVVFSLVYLVAALDSVSECEENPCGAKYPLQQGLGPGPGGVVVAHKGLHSDLKDLSFCSCFSESFGCYFYIGISDRYQQLTPPEYG